MTDVNILAFYQTVRNSPEMWRDRAETTDESAMTAKVMELSAAQGIALSPDEIRSALPRLPEIIDEASGDGDLTDDELELVSAGVLMRCSHKVDMT